MRDDPRPFTQKEAQETFLRHVYATAEYWARHGNACDPRSMCHGLAHSILTILDGLSGSHPAVTCTISPHPDDKQYHIDNGDNYYEYGTDLHGRDILNDIYYQVNRHTTKGTQ